MMALSCDILDHAEIDTGKVIWDLLTSYLAVHREKKIRPMTRNMPGTSIVWSRMGLVP